MQALKSNIFSVKVHPSSLSIDGTLGNVRLCDTSLGSDQCWDWLCDIRNPGVDSLIKVCSLPINSSCVFLFIYLFRLHFAIFHYSNKLFYPLYCINYFGFHISFYFINTLCQLKLVCFDFGEVYIQYNLSNL